MEEGSGLNISLIVGVIALVIIGVGAYLLFFANNTEPVAENADTASEQVGSTEVDVSQQVSGATDNPTEDLPQTNPFETETNPFRGYKNPFGN